MEKLNLKQKILGCGFMLQNYEAIYTRDVKEAVLEFEKELNSFEGLTPQFEEILKHLKERFKKIIGDFEK